MKYSMDLIIEGIYYFIKITIGFEILELLFERKSGRRKWILFITELFAGAFHVVNTAITMHTFSNNEKGVERVIRNVFEVN